MNTVYHFDGINGSQLSSFGITSLKVMDVFALPKMKAGAYTNYDQEGFQIKPSEYQEIQYEGVISAGDFATFTGYVGSLYVMLMSAGLKALEDEATAVADSFFHNGVSLSNIQVDEGGFVVALIKFKTYFREVVDVSTITDLQVAKNGTTISLSWSDQSVLNYRIYRKETVEASYTLLDTSNSNSFDDVVVDGGTYYYVVTAVNSAGAESEFSNEVSIEIFAFTFETSKSPSGPGNDAFSPSIVYNGLDTPIWRFDNGYEFEGDSMNDEDGTLTGLDGSTQTVKLILGDKSLITSFDSSYDSIVGALDFSSFVGAAFTNISGLGNASLNALNANVTWSNGFTLNFFGCSIATLTMNTDSNAEVGTIDFTSNNLTAFSRGNLVYSNSIVKFGNCSLAHFETRAGDSFTELTLTNNNVSTGDFSLIDMVGSSAILAIQNNPIDPAIPAVFTGDLSEFKISGTLKSGVLDLSQYSWASAGALQIEATNTAVTGVTPPDTSSWVSSYAIGDNPNWNQTTVDFTGITPATAGSGNRTNISIVNLLTVTTITQLKTATGTIGQLNFSGCDLTGIIDLSGYEFRGSNQLDFSIANNSNMTRFLLGPQVSSYRTMNFSGTNVGTSDLMADVISNLLPEPIDSISTNETSLSFANLGYTASEMNDLFVDLDAVYPKFAKLRIYGIRDE